MSIHLQGYSPESLLDARARLVEAVVSCACGVPVAELRASTRRGAPVAFARQVAMYLSHVALGLSLTATGRCFGRDRTTAAHACRLVEAHRDDPRFDLSLTHLERALSLAAQTTLTCAPDSALQGDL